MLITLPWPPTINHYYMRTAKGVIINKKGREYRKTAFYLCREFQGSFSEEDRLSLFIAAYPPDKRRRDLDNIFKVCLDSLQFAKVFPNDYQISELSIKRMPEREGRLAITLERI